METVTDAAQIERYKALVAEMMTEHRKQFAPLWVAKAGWKVVPAAL